VAGGAAGDNADRPVAFLRNYSAERLQERGLQGGKSDFERLGPRDDDIIMAWLRRKRFEESQRFFEAPPYPVARDRSAAAPAHGKAKARPGIQERLRARHGLQEQAAAPSNFAPPHTRKVRMAFQSQGRGEYLCLRFGHLFSRAETRLDV